jgi:hypothetical protein
LPRLLVCRPQGGLKDMLCQIEQCCRYAERFDRTVLVETDLLWLDRRPDEESHHGVTI